MRLSKFRYDRANFNHVFFWSISVLNSLLFTLGLFSLIASIILAPTVCANPVVANDSTEKTVGQYRKDLMAFVKRSKDKSDYNQRFGAVFDLCRLHRQLINDSRFHLNQQLKGFRAIAADRLAKCSKEIEVEIKRTKRKNDRLRKLERSKSRSNKVAQEKIVSQIPNPISKKQYLENALVQDMELITQIAGGPVNVWQYTGPNFGPNGICDYGPSLVQLIESTISPDSWQANGGNGVIHYYQPLRILVVSASSQVHDQLTDLLNQLR